MARALAQGQKRAGVGGESNGILQAHAARKLSGLHGRIGLTLALRTLGICVRGGLTQRLHPLPPGQDLLLGAEVAEQASPVVATLVLLEREVDARIALAHIVREVHDLLGHLAGHADRVVLPLLETVLLLLLLIPVLHHLRGVVPRGRLGAREGGVVFGEHAAGERRRGRQGFEDRQLQGGGHERALGGAAAQGRQRVVVLRRVVLQVQEGVLHGQAGAPQGARDRQGRRDPRRRPVAALRLRARAASAGRPAAGRADAVVVFGRGVAEAVRLHGHLHGLDVEVGGVLLLLLRGATAGRGRHRLRPHGQGRLLLTNCCSAGAA
mmetsp:Transcript_4397/g.11948  ORF Transcript_4397/g.11948 Transcript_4397/m.11948 type:complete len:323 (+) Transcript_4397:477-1445(+)